MKELALKKNITVFLIVIAALSVSLPGAFSTGPLWPDGQRYTFNGILLHDMVRDGEIFHPYNYNVKFYAHYPATNLPYGPPFFALVFAAAFSILGISFSVARLVIVFYTICAALMCWYLVYKIDKNYWCSILAVAAFLFNPFIARYSRDISPELANAFFSFLTIYLFYNYVEYEKKYFGIFTALALGLGYLTKQYMIPLGMALPLYIIIRRKWHILFKLETLFAVIIAIVLIVPYSKLSFMTMNRLGPGTKPPLDWDLLLNYPAILIKQLPILTIVAGIGFIIGLMKKNKLILLCLIWAICWYVFFTFSFSNVLSDKFICSFVPSIIFPFALASNEIIIKLKGMYFDKAAIILLILWFAYSALSVPVFYIRGYEDAGKYVAENPRGKSVLFHGNYDGAFMMGIRRHISQDGPYVLRGDRHLAIRLWYEKAKAYESIESSNEIMEILDKYQTGYIVVEHDIKKEDKYPEYKILLSTLKNTALFEEVARFPILTNYNKGLGSELFVYKVHFNNDASKTDTIKIPIPTLDRYIETPF